MFASEPQGDPLNMVRTQFLNSVKIGSHCSMSVRKVLMPMSLFLLFIAPDTAIPRYMLPLDMLTPQIRNMLFLIFFKKIPDMLILVIYLPPTMLFLISQRTMPL